MRHIRIFDWTQGKNLYPYNNEKKLLGIFMTDEYLRNLVILIASVMKFSLDDSEN